MKIVIINKWKYEMKNNGIIINEIIMKIIWNNDVIMKIIE